MPPSPPDGDTPAQPLEEPATRLPPEVPFRQGVVILPQGLQLEREEPIVPCHIGWQSMGPEDAPVVVALGGISAQRHIAAHAGNHAAGWWEVVTGPGKALDTERYRIVGMDWIGGPGDSSSPRRRPGLHGIPAVTTGDQAAGVAAVLDHLGVRRAHALVGASYGAMVGLAFGARFPRRARHIMAVSGAHESHPMATALRSLQRRIVLNGYREGGNAREAVVLARALAMTTYRSALEFRERFSNVPRLEDGMYRFPVEDYLEHQGRRFAERFHPDHFLYLCQSLDLHRVDPYVIGAPVTLVSVLEDTLVLPEQMRELAAALPDGRLVEIRSPMGHDAFLTEGEVMGRLLREVLEG